MKKAKRRKAGKRKPAKAKPEDLWPIGWHEGRPYNIDKIVIVTQPELRALLREASRVGCAAAIEHAGNFWQAGEGYRKYIDEQVMLQAEALMTSVRSAVRAELKAKSRRQR